MKKLLFILSISIFSVSFIISCGGGGGGGGGGIPITGDYQGATTQATITADNYVDIAIGAWFSGYVGTSINLLGVVQSVPKSAGSVFSPGQLPLVFENVFSRIDVSTFIPQTYLGAVIEIEPATIMGFCNDPFGDEGATISGTVNDATGAFDFSINFNNYCDTTGVIINGLADMTGSMNLDFFEPEKYTIEFISLDLEESGGSATLDGSIQADHTVWPIPFTMSYVLKDNDADKTYWFRDVTLMIELNGGSTNIVDISGMARYYDPDEGYVVLGIDENIVWLDVDVRPSSGSLTLQGENDTKVRLTFINTDQYRVDADTNGDGFYDDYTTGIVNWNNEAPNDINLSPINEGSWENPVPIELGIPYNGQVETRGTSFYAATGLEPGVYTVFLSDLTGDTDLHLYSDGTYSMELDCTLSAPGDVLNEPQDCTFNSTGGIYASVSSGELNRDGAFFVLLAN